MEMPTIRRRCLCSGTVAEARMKEWTSRIHLSFTFGSAFHLSFLSPGPTPGVGDASEG